MTKEKETTIKAWAIVKINTGKFVEDDSGEVFVYVNIDDAWKMLSFVNGKIGGCKITRVKITKIYERKKLKKK